MASQEIFSVADEQQRKQLIERNSRERTIRIAQLDGREGCTVENQAVERSPITYSGPETLHNTTEVGYFNAAGVAVLQYNFSIARILATEKVRGLCYELSIPYTETGKHLPLKQIAQHIIKQTQLLERVAGRLEQK